MDPSFAKVNKKKDAYYAEINPVMKTGNISNVNININMLYNALYVKVVTAPRTPFGLWYGPYGFASRIIL